ncbi:MAG TPA: hypothetical protein V6C69_03940 [Trichormus sp.]
MTIRNHPPTRTDRTAEQSPAERQETAQHLYADAEYGWFQNLQRSATNIDQLQTMLPNVSVDDYSSLAKANDRNRRQLDAINNQLAAKPQAQSNGDANVQSNQAQQPQAPQNTNPIDQQVALMRGQLTEVENDYHQIDQAFGGQNGTYKYDQIEQLAHNPSSAQQVAAQAAARELLGLYHDPTGINLATSHVSDFANGYGNISWDSVEAGKAIRDKQIDAINSKYTSDSSAFHTISVNDNNATGILPTDVLKRLSNDDPAVHSAAQNLNPGNNWDYRWENPHSPMITQHGIDGAALMDLRKIDLPVAQPKTNTPAASGAPQNSDGTNSPPGQTDWNQLTAEQTRLSTLTALEAKGLQIDPQINDNLGKVISGGGYYQVAERLLGITDLRKRPSAAQAKELKLLTGILEQEASKSNNHNNGVPRHLKAGQSLLSADNIRDAMEQLDAIIQATRTDRPTPPATPAISA